VCAPRLSGDYNPLHIDPEVSRRVGFNSPILHGLATMGISVRQVLKLFGADKPDSIRSVKVGAVFREHRAVNRQQLCWLRAAQVLGGGEGCCE
jgi:acyl dehydratase